MFRDEQVEVLNLLYKAVELLEKIEANTRPKKKLTKKKKGDS
jgi:hypothetical protein